MRTHTAETQASMSPKKALQFLQEGNERFQRNLKANRNLLQQVNETSEGQFPFAAVLSCIDSRTSAELIFDQGLGDIFSVRIAGNFVNTDILGSLEYACLVAGSKLIVVLGHTHCGAVNAACQNPSTDGNIGHLLANILPAVDLAKESCPDDCNADALANKAAEFNVQLTVQRILEESPQLAEMMQKGAIDIVGGIYDVKTGVVNFLPQQAAIPS